MDPPLWCAVVFVIFDILRVGVNLCLMLPIEKRIFCIIRLWVMVVVLDKLTNPRFGGRFAIFVILCIFYLSWLDSTFCAKARADGMSFGFAAKSTSVRLRLSPEMKIRKASSRNIS